MTRSGPDAPRIALACLDMAGTTVEDAGAVSYAFAAALDEVGVVEGSAEWERMAEYVADTMGTSKIVVFRALFDDEQVAEKANAAFEADYEERIASGAVVPIAGAEEAIAELRGAGVKVALHTGFSVVTRNRLVAALGWEEIADLLLCPAEAGRGRPYPDMVLTSLLVLGVDDVAAVAFCGDTAADVEAGRHAGASVVAGVLTGADGAARLLGAGATHVLGSIAELPGILGIR